MTTKREHSPQTRALCGDHLPALDAMAEQLGQPISVITQTIFAEWFAAHPEAALRFNAPRKAKAAGGSR